MNVLVCYVVVSQAISAFELAARFVGSWLACAPGSECSLVVACNGGPLPIEIECLFDSLPCSFLLRENDPGWDISAYIEVSKKYSCDMLLCLGSSVYFHREGWLSKIVQAWNAYGPGLYGFFSSNLICPHLCTTAFAVSPRHLAAWLVPQNKFERYQTEHGEHSFWRHIKSLGQPVKLVTWDGVYDPPRWRDPRDILWKGSQTNCLFYCNHVDRYREANPATKRKWQRAADAPFR